MMAKFEKEDEIRAMEDIAKLYDGDLSDFVAAKEIDPDMKRFLDSDPPISKLNRAQLALLEAINSRSRRQAKRHKRPGKS